MSPQLNTFFQNMNIRQRGGTAANIDGLHSKVNPMSVFSDKNLPQYQPMSPSKALFFGGGELKHQKVNSYNDSYKSDNNSTSVGESRKQRTQLKAELVRRELLSRGDLIRLYQPPIPKSQIPISNPFYTKTIVVVSKAPLSNHMTPYQPVAVTS